MPCAALRGSMSRDPPLPARGCTVIDTSASGRRCRRAPRRTHRASGRSPRRGSRHDGPPSSCHRHRRAGPAARGTPPCSPDGAGSSSTSSAPAKRTPASLEAEGVAPRDEPDAVTGRGGGKTVNVSHPLLAGERAMHARDPGGGGRRGNLLVCPLAMIRKKSMQTNHRRVSVTPNARPRATAYKITVPSVRYLGSHHSMPPGYASSSR